jgi:hypothetical protein
MRPTPRVRSRPVVHAILADVFTAAPTWVFNALRWTWHDPNGYNIVSGPLADITLLGGAYAIARHHNCHVRGCWRVGRAKVPGTEYIVCRAHHPHETPTAEKVLADHAAAAAEHTREHGDPTKQARET